MDNICWKCRRYSPDNVLGLCYECTPSFVFLVGFVAVMLATVLVFMFTHTMSDDVTESILNSFFSVILAVFVTGVVFLFSYLVLWKWLISWIVAIVRNVKSAIGEAIAERQRNLMDEAVERAKLANPQHLNGQQVDSLLTEQYKEKMGWKQ